MGSVISAVWVFSDPNIAVPFPGYRFAEPGTCNHGNRENDVGHVIHVLGELSPKNAISGAAALGLSDVHERHIRGRIPLTNVTNCEDVGHIRPHVVARRDVSPFVHFDAGGIQIQIMCIGVAPNRE